MKDEKELRKDIICSLPDCSENQASFIKAEYLERQEKKKKKKKLGVRLAWGMPIAAAFLAVVIAVPVVMNNNIHNDPTPGSNSGNSGNSGTVQPVNVDILAKHQDVANNVDIGVHVLMSQGTSSTLNRLLARPLYAITQDELVGHLNDLNPFMPTAERMMGGVESVSTLTYLEGAEYPYSMTFEDGTVLSYKEERIAGHEDDEEQFRLEGVATIGEKSYEVSGRREVEIESGESEYETSFTIYLDSNASIKIESGLETETSETEQSYAYQYLEGRSVTLEAELSYEKEEGDEEEMKIVINPDSQKAEYLLTETSGGFSMQTKIEDEDEDYERTLTVIIDEANSLYIYKDGANVIAELPRR